MPETVGSKLGLSTRDALHPRHKYFLKMKLRPVFSDEGIHKPFKKSWIPRAKKIIEASGDWYGKVKNIKISGNIATFVIDAFDKSPRPYLDQIIWNYTEAAPDTWMEGDIYLDDDRTIELYMDVIEIRFFMDHVYSIKPM